MSTFTHSAYSLVPKTLTPNLKPSAFNVPKISTLRFTNPAFAPPRQQWSVKSRLPLAVVKFAVDSSSSDKSSSDDDDKMTIRLPGCDYNHWLVVLDFPKDPPPTRDEMIDKYLETLSTVLGSMEEAKKNMYAFSTTTYTGFQCTVDEETSEKFKALPGVLWVLPDSYLDVKLKDYGGDKYVNGEIFPCKYPTYQPSQNRNNSKYVSKRYERRRDGPIAEPSKPKQEAATTDSSG